MGSATIHGPAKKKNYFTAGGALIIQSMMSDGKTLS